MKKEYIYAFLIGLSFGVLVYGVTKNGINFWVLPPLLAIYLLVKAEKADNSKKNN